MENNAPHSSEQLPYVPMHISQVLTYTAEEGRNSEVFDEFVLYAHGFLITAIEDRSQAQ